MSDTQKIDVEAKNLQARLDEAVGLFKDLKRSIAFRRDYPTTAKKMDSFLASLDTNQKCMKPDNSMQKNGKVNDGRLEGEGAK